MTSPAGQKVYYFRDLRWSPHRPDDVWSTSQQQARAVDLKLKYYPYYSKLRLAVNYETMPMKEKKPRNW